MTNKERLEKALKEIGWSLRPMGCKHYRLVTQKNQTTDWEFYEPDLRLRGRAFGYDRYGTKGLCTFNLNHCKVSVDGNGIGVTPKRHHNAAWVFFYNFDDRR